MESVMKYMNNLLININDNDNDSRNIDIDSERFHGNKHYGQRCHDRKSEMSLAAVLAEVREQSAGSDDKVVTNVDSAQSVLKLLVLMQLYISDGNNSNHDAIL